MPHRRLIKRTKALGQSITRKGIHFRQRFDDLEARRAALLIRLENLSALGQAHPASKRALRLLNQTFRATAVAKRAAILQAADWVISLIEISGPMI